MTWPRRSRTWTTGSWWTNPSLTLGGIACSRGGYRLRAIGDSRRFTDRCRAASFTRVIQRGGLRSVLITRLKPRLGTRRERGASVYPKRSSGGKDPQPTVAGYSSRSLVDKLGIKPGTRIAILNAPRGYRTTLGKLPPGVIVGSRVRGSLPFIHFFVKSRDVLEAQLPVLLRGL